MKRLRGGGPWLLFAAGLFICARAGFVPAVAQGLAVGFAIGGAYVWLLWRRTSSLAGLPPHRAVAAAQFAAVLRFCFVFAAFGAVARIWPEAALGWGVGAFLMPTAFNMFVMARGG